MAIMRINQGPSAGKFVAIDTVELTKDILVLALCFLPAKIASAFLSSSSSFPIRSTFLFDFFSSFPSPHFALTFVS